MPRAGTYDIGISTLTGNNVEFAEPPRCFRFSGITAKNDRVFVYTVAQDQGCSATMALELFNDAKSDTVLTSRSGNGFIGRGQLREIVTGFYKDSRSGFKVTAKGKYILVPGLYFFSTLLICIMYFLLVFLVINPGKYIFVGTSFFSLSTPLICIYFLLSH